MAKKFGTFRGVFIPSTEAILGTVLFLLLPQLTADVGLIPLLAILLIAHSVTISTACSLADCATNLTRIEGGGIYALSKLSLGKAMGGSIGIPLYLAQAASVGFYCIGFAEPLHPVLSPLLEFIPLFQLATPEALLIQKQLLATAFLVFFFLIVMIGADFTLKIQSAILVILALSVGAIFFSPLLGLEFQSQPLFTRQLNLFGNRAMTIGIFFLSFTRFFPAVTGISTGIGMSGDLKTPQKSIVRGTFLSIFITMIIYIGVTFIFSYMDKGLLISRYEQGVPIGALLTEILGLGKDFPQNLPGLLILLGVLFATGSSALSVFMTGPRTVQFLAKDNILPRALSFLERDFVKGGHEPRFAMLVTLGFGLVIIWMGNISLAATVVGILFLVVYGWVNLAAFLERVSHNPSFRPTFKGHWLISLFGFLACSVTICLYDWRVGALITISQYVMFRLILKHKSGGELEGVWWGVLFTLITRSIDKLRSIVQGSRNWRPVLLSIGFASERLWWQELGSIADNIASYRGLVSSNLISHAKLIDSLDAHKDSLVETSIIESSSPTEAALTLIQASELTGIESNTVLIEYNEKTDTVKILNAILQRNKNILLYKGLNAKVSSEMVKAKEKRLDIWWRGERNGNFMALLAYIINRGITPKEDHYTIRILRMIGEKEDEKMALNELNNLFDRARIEGKVAIVPYRNDPFTDILEQESSDASLIMMGVPGNYVENTKGRFSFNEFLFGKEMGKYRELPPILFVRSRRAISLTDD